MSTPKPHQSTLRVYEVSVRTSGAKNSGVPQKVPVRSPYPIPSLHSPKSAIFTYPSVSNNKLSNFKSLKYKGIRQHRLLKTLIKKNSSIPINNAIFM